MLTSIYTKGFHVLQATSCRPQAAGCKLQATGCRRGATASQGLQAAGNKLQVELQATSIMFWGGPQDHFGMLAGFQKAVISICICCLGVARWNYFSNMWDRQISMRLTRGATYVVGGRVGMDETHQVNIHFNWDNLSLFSPLSSLLSIPIPY